MEIFPAVRIHSTGLPGRDHEIHRDNGSGQDLFYEIVMGFLGEMKRGNHRVSLNVAGYWFEDLLSVTRN